MEFILVVYGKNMNKKHGAKKLAMSTEWMQDLFSPMFFLCPQGYHLGCFWEEKNVQFCAQNILWEHISCFHKQNCVRLWRYVIRQSVKRSDVCCENRKYVLVKCLCTKLDILFSQKHWRSSPWEHRKKIGENISCIHLVDIANFLAPCILFMFLP